MKTITVALFFCAGLLAQTPKVQLEVASIRPTTPEVATGGAATAGVRVYGELPNFAWVRWFLRY